MTSYRSYSILDIKEKEAAKGKKSRNKQKFLQMFHVQGHASRFFKKSPWPPEAKP